jgi:hypothetical protein
MQVKSKMVWVLSCYTKQHKSVSIMNTFCRHGLSNSVLSLVNDDTHQEGQEEKWNNELGK